MTTAAIPFDRHREVWSRYRSNLPRHLIGIARHLQSETMRVLAQGGGFDGLRLSFEPYIALVGEQGCRLTDLADALGISKQACNQTADAIERAGYLRRVPAAGDRRAKQLQLTPRGRELARAGTATVAAIEAGYGELVGARRIARLAELVGQLAPVAAVVPPGADALLGYALPRLSHAIMQRLMEYTRSLGHADLKLSHGQVLGLIGPNGGYLLQMARIQQVSKQAVGAVARELEELGYIERSPDPADARQSVLRLNLRGVRLLEDSIRSVDRLEAEFAAAIGARALAELKQIAAGLYAALGLEAEVFTPAGELQRLAQRLRRQLGDQGAAELARLLQQDPVEDDGHAV